MCNAQKAASLALGKLPEGVASLIIFAEVHRYKYSDFYSFHELFCSTHIIFSDTAVHPKHGYIYGRCSLLQLSHFGQKVTFGLAYFLRSRFLAPVPVVQVTGMEQPSALQVYQEGDTHIGRTEGLDTDMFVFVGVALIDVGGIFR